MKFLFKRAACFILFCTLITVSAEAQLYNNLVQHRPPGMNWQQLQSPHFNIIYPDGEDSLAYRAASILEEQYQSTAALTGGTLQNFPVVLNTANDLSNGFVTSLNFRSEIDLPPIKGKEMNPRTGDWLEIVLPHELVHATHFNALIPKDERIRNVPGALSYLSPDLGRTFHAFAPFGVHEGLAVLHETEAVAEGGGRGNYMGFNNRFNANFSTGGRWNMGQTLIPSEYSLPFSRHYIAGYTFTDWLHEHYGEDISKRAIRFHHSYFFMGYGYALRHTTGKWPGALYDDYTTDLAKKESVRRKEVGGTTEDESRVLDLVYSGEQNRRPVWISDQKLLFFGRFYDGNLGFYEYNLSTDYLRRLREEFTVGDYNYDLNAFGDELLFSAFQKDPLYPGVYTMDLFRLNVRNGNTQRLSHGKRLYAPASNGEHMLALQTHKASARIVEIVNTDSIQVLAEPQDATPVRLAFNPVRANELAVVMNRRGVQGIWLTTLDNLSGDLRGEPDLAFTDASAFDPEWHPNGDRLLFTIEKNPAMNVFEYNLENQEIRQVTRSMYNAYEASYSIDGDRIAYTMQDKQEQKIAVLNREDFDGSLLEESARLSGADLQEALNRPLLGNDAETGGWMVSSYETDYSWVKPRMMLPVFREQSNRFQGGISFSSTDVLSSQGYYAEITGLQNRFWYDLSYTNKTFMPGFSMRAYSEPDFFLLRDPADNSPFEVMQQERGLELSVPFTYTFRADTRLTSLYIEPELQAEQIRVHSLDPEPLSDFANRYQAGLGGQFSYNILSRSRDVQPVSGLVLFGFLEKSLNSPSLDIRTQSGAQTQASFSNQWSAYYGAFGYLSPLKSLNQSLRIDLQFLQQSETPVYSTDTIIPAGFSENPFPTYLQDDVNNKLGRLSTRYTVPLFYPDNGGLTLPLYISSVYLTGFTHTLANLNADASLIKDSRSILGAGFHVQFKVSNLSFDIGVGIAFEPSRNQSQLIIGQF